MTLCDCPKSQLSSKEDKFVLNSRTTVGFVGHEENSMVERMVPGDSIVVAAKDQVSCDLAGEAVILHLKSGMYYGLNTVGARIWDLIQAPMTVDALRDTLLQEYNVEPQLCERELLTLLEELAVQGLVEVKHAPTA
jgi:Coenzyme PQQ synthesis protein D (PqqD)